MAYKESNRYLYLDTPLGADQLFLTGFSGQEGLSQLFEFHLELIAQNDTDIDFDQLIGQKVSFGILGEGTVPARDFNGIVVQFSQSTRDEEFTGYRMTVVPEFWKLTAKHQSRIFQHITIPDILKQCLSELSSVAYEIQGTFEQREYCTQYQESDFDFVSRLMEEEGIYYFFKFTKGAHKLVLANTPGSHPEIPGESKLIYEEVSGGAREEERVSAWEKIQRWGSGKFTVWDHHFQLPHKHLDTFETLIDTVQVGDVSHKRKLAGNDGMEVYENPARYAQRFDGIDKAGGEKEADLQKIFQDNKRTAGIRIQQTEAPMLTIHAGSNCRQITSGHKFTLQRHFNADDSYVIVTVSHSGEEGGFRSGDEEITHYSNSFLCLPFSVPYRPPRVTHRPLIAGPQSSVVVGPDGEEIFTDKYGRIKVKFHWDRSDTQAANCSCWLRVGTLWAGQNWGGMHIPRIGQEVIVGFLEGDPDRPLVIGSVYNPDQMPPYTLPDKKTVSTFKSRSTKKGGKDNFNELRFEDLKGSEQVFFHAERDRDERVKAEAREYIGGNRSLIVKKNQKEAVTGGKYSTVGGEYVLETDGDKHEHIKGSHYEKTDGDHEYKLVGTNKEEIDGANSLHIQGDDKEKVDGDMSLTVGGSLQEKTGMKFAHEAGQEIHLKAGMKVILEAGVQLTIKASGGFVDIGPSGVTIQGIMVLINSGGAAGSGSGSSPTSPDAPGTVKAPAQPDVADDGTKFDKM